MNIYICIYRYIFLQGNNFCINKMNQMRKKEGKKMAQKFIKEKKNNYQEKEKFWTNKNNALLS